MAWIELHGYYDDEPVTFNTDDIRRFYRDCNFTRIFYRDGDYDDVRETYTWVRELIIDAVREGKA